MAKGKGGRGGRGKGKGKSDDQDRGKGRKKGEGKDNRKPAKHDDYYDDGWGGDEDGGWGHEEGWGGDGGEWNAQEAVAQIPPQPIARPLAAQWRFACRILQRHTPEEPVTSIRRQVHLGDHLLVRYSWELTEQHGIVCSVTADDGYERRGARGNQETHFLVHWDGGKLVRLPLSEFSKGGELFRVNYPHWVCQCWLPWASTVKPYIVDEKWLESVPGEAVAKQAGRAFRDASWYPNWAQAPDLEFCIYAKTGGEGLPWEVHSRKSLSSVVLAPLGCCIGGERRPSLVFGAAKGPPLSPTNSGQSAPPGFPGQPTWAGHDDNYSGQQFGNDPFHNQDNPSVGGPGFPSQQPNQPWDWGWPGAAAASHAAMQHLPPPVVPAPNIPPTFPVSLQAATSGMSATAAEFVPNMTGMGMTYQ